MAKDIHLPSLGDASSAIISPKQEQELGQAWLRAYRSRVNEHDDPELYDYIEKLIQKLSPHSELQDHNLSLIAINNASMNAFAVPGGVIGVHTGLFRFAKSEHQLASVLAHELAHLSQRHFARRVEEQRKNAKVTMAGMLASLVLAATVGGDAGIAAMTATQAVGLENSLRYSRQNEQEADRLGIQTMQASGFDPRAVAGMFEEMLKATRYSGSRPPEFLLTHPLTENRVADAQNRVNRLPQKHYEDNPTYHLMRARAIIAIHNNPATSINRFKNELNGVSLSKQAAQYGMALAYGNWGKFDQAKAHLRPLLKAEPNNVTYQLAQITLDRQQGQYITAIEKNLQLLAEDPNSYPLNMALAETYLKANQFTRSEKVLKKMTRLYPMRPYVWFQLAETSGLAGDVAEVHKARARYFILNGVFDKARNQLGYARKLLKQNYYEVAIIDQQLRDLEKLEKQMEEFGK